MQAQGLYNYFPGFQEGQVDLGLVNRVGHVQAGAFASLKYLNFGQFQQGAVLGQASFMADYLFDGGKVGVYRHRGLQEYRCPQSNAAGAGRLPANLSRASTPQFGFSATVGAWGDAYVQGNAGVIFAHYQGNKPGFNIKLVQPIVNHLAFTAQLGYNENYIAQNGNIADVRFGLLFGGILHPKDFGKVDRPQPMDVPQIRYEIATRRVGSSPPIADAGPNQLNITPAIVTLNGSGSYDPLGETLTYSWTQIAGPQVVITNATSAIATFPALAGQTYSFRLTVKNTDNLTGTASTTVSVVTRRR